MLLPHCERASSTSIQNNRQKKKILKKKAKKDLRVCFRIVIGYLYAYFETFELASSDISKSQGLICLHKAFTHNWEQFCTSSAHSRHATPPAPSLVATFLSTGIWEANTNN